MASVGLRYPGIYDMYVELVVLGVAHADCDEPVRSCSREAASCCIVLPSPSVFNPTRSFLSSPFCRTDSMSGAAENNR